MNADGTGQINLTNNSFPDDQPAWSPDGSKIAFVSARTGDTNRNVYVMDTNPATNDAVSITPNVSDPIIPTRVTTTPRPGPPTAPGSLTSTPSLATDMACQTSGPWTPTAPTRPTLPKTIPCRA
jgi:hypothetical protein